MRISDWSSDVCSSDLDRRHDRQPRLGEQRLQFCGGGLLAVTLDRRALQMPDAGERTRDQHWPKRGGEDEARRIGTDHVDDVAIGRDIAAHHADRLAERPFDDRSEEHTYGLQYLM